MVVDRSFERAMDQATLCKKWAGRGLEGCATAFLRESVNSASRLH